MAVKFTVFERKNPMNPSADAKWYAGTKSDGEVTLKSPGREISGRCTVTHADTLAVLEGLTQVLTENSAEGRIVRFGDFGSFRIGIGSNGAIKEELFHQSMIRTRKVRFNPGSDLKEMLNNLKFEKVSK
jgi:predicted histone-like DNA-binding protein